MNNSIDLLRTWLNQHRMYDVLEALEFAKVNHGDQTRDEGIPYIYHPVEVVWILIHNNIVYPRVLKVALLHDILATVSFKDFLTKFGQSVTDDVFALTELKTESEDEHFQKILSSQFSYASLCKMADRMHNIRSIHLASEEKQRHYKFKTEKYFFPFIKECKQHFPESLSFYDKGLKEIKKNLELL